jgi:hypothetical protein
MNDRNFDASEVSAICQQLDYWVANATLGVGTRRILMRAADCIRHLSTTPCTNCTPSISSGSCTVGERDNESNTADATTPETQNTPQPEKLKNEKPR